MAPPRHSTTLSRVETIMAAANGATDRMEVLEKRAKHPENRSIIEWVLIRLALIEQEARLLRNDQEDMRQEREVLRQEIAQLRQALRERSR